MIRALAIALGMSCVLRLVAAGDAAAAGWPRQSDAPGAGGVAFVPSSQCAGCHAEQAARFAGSHHDLAMQPAKAETVLGNFDRASFRHMGVTSRFFRKDGKYFVNTAGVDGKLADFEVAYTFGVEPLQQYLIAFPGGRLQALSIAWDTEKKSWFHLYPGEEIEAGDALHWTGRYLTWNAMCAECHSTNLEKHYDAASDTYRTTWAEIDVSCQACHGPGAAHVAWANQKEAKDSGKYADDNGLVVRFGARSGSKNEGKSGATNLLARSRGEVEACARCHSRRRRVSVEDRHGRPFLDDFAPELLQPGLYHADGQILDEVYVYGSFLQSAMYREGVACTDCHDPHSLATHASGNALCVRCHGPTPDSRFPALRSANYDTSEHHHHPKGSAGAQCVACHMPVRTYMQVDPRRDHSFRVPRPDQSLALGTPNACTDCHADRNASWAFKAVKQWKGWSAGEARRAAHFAPALSDARAGERTAMRKLQRLADDTEQPGIARATALELFRLYAPIEPSERATLINALRDEDALVRATAAGELDILPPELRLELAAPLLSDPIRAVRIGAARSLTSIPEEAFTKAAREHFDAALAEYTGSLQAAGDLPASHLNLGVLHTQRGDTEAALRAYATALRLDPRFLPASMNLANLYNRLGRNTDSERILREALAHAPKEAEIHYSLGLLLAEENRLEEAEMEIGAAATLMPQRARFHYNHALALQQLGRRFEAGEELREAQTLDPDDPDIVRALTIFYIQQNELNKALLHARALAELTPGDPRARQLLQRIEIQRQTRGPR